MRFGKKILNNDYYKLIADKTGKIDIRQKGLPIKVFPRDYLQKRYNVEYCNGQFDPLLFSPYFLIMASLVWRRLEKGGRFGVERETADCESEDSTFMGDEHGRPWDFDWVVRSQWQNNDGGPWGW